MWRKDVLATTPYSVNRIPCDLVPLGYWWLESLGAHLHGCFLQKECAVGVRLQNLCWRYQTSVTLNESFSHVFSSNVTTNGGTCVPWLTSLLPWPKAYRRSTSIRSTILNSELVSCSSRWRPHWAKCLCSISPSLSWASSQESFCLQNAWDSVWPWQGQERSQLRPFWASSSQMLAARQDSVPCRSTKQTLGWPLPPTYLPGTLATYTKACLERQIMTQESHNSDFFMLLKAGSQCITRCFFWITPQTTAGFYLWDYHTLYCTRDGQKGAVSQPWQGQTLLDQSSHTIIITMIEY